MKAQKYDRIMIRFDPALGKKIRALAKRRNLTVTEYCRLMCCVEILNDDPDMPVAVLQQLKEVLADTERFTQFDPQEQVEAMRRGLNAIEAVQKAAKEAMTWMNALVRASDAYSRARQTGGPQDARSRDEGDTNTPATR
jgi:hypothetical protein